MTPQPAIPNVLGANILLQGPPGSGKTYALRTIVEAGYDLRYLPIEPNFEELIALRDVKYNYVRPGVAGWDDLIVSAKLINTQSNEALQKMHGVQRSAFAQFIEMLNLCNDFIDIRTGKHYGDISTWDNDVVFVIDGLTGISKLSRTLAVGSKPIMTQPDWGVAMDNITRFLDKVCYDTKCHFVLIAHVEPEKDEVSGLVKNMVSTLGRKLAPTIPVPFQDVILARREGNQFYWSTIDSRSDLKKGHLEFSDKLAPSFVPLFAQWRKMAEAATL